MAKMGAFEIQQPSIEGTPDALRYYIPELQNAVNAEPFDIARYKRAQAKQMRLNRAYLLQLTKLKDRLSKKSYSLFCNPKAPLFDADLFEFSFGDGVGSSAGVDLYRSRKALVRARFKSFDGKMLHILTYKDIAAFDAKLPAVRWFGSSFAERRMDSLIHHELTSINNKLMQHSYLFVSGATVTVQFQRVKWDTQRISSRA